MANCVKPHALKAGITPIVSMLTSLKAVIWVDYLEPVTLVDLFGKLNSW